MGKVILIEKGGDLVGLARDLLLSEGAGGAGGEDLAKCLVVFPGRRPGNFLTRAFPSTWNADMPFWMHMTVSKELSKKDSRNASIWAQKQFGTFFMVSRPKSRLGREMSMPTTALAFPAIAGSIRP